jgi:hypothetical protein
MSCTNNVSEINTNNLQRVVKSNEKTINHNSYDECTTGINVRYNKTDKCIVNSENENLKTILVDNMLMLMSSRNNESNIGLIMSAYRHLALTCIIIRNNQVSYARPISCNTDVNSISINSIGTPNNIPIMTFTIDNPFLVINIPLIDKSY